LIVVVKIEKSPAWGIFFDDNGEMRDDGGKRRDDGGER
jgi:hypothetical protein